MPPGLCKVGARATVKRKHLPIQLVTLFPGRSVDAMFWLPGKE